MSFCMETSGSLPAEPEAAGEAAQAAEALSCSAMPESLLRLARAGPSSSTTWESSPPRTPLAAGISKQAQEREIFSAVRRQMETLEEKLCSQIARAQQQSDRSRDAAFSRVDLKLGTMESIQPRVDRRLAELNGNCKGLSEEVQVQIRRIDQLDSRLWEWRHKLDEDIRTKFVEIEQANQQISSSVRVTNAASEDVLKRFNQRLLRLESLADERSGQHEDMSQSLVSLHTRLLEVENNSVPEPGSHTRSPLEALMSADHNGSNSLCGGSIDAQLPELTQKLALLEQEFYDLRVRVESQEEHHRSLRTLHETKDEQFRNLSERIERENWDGRLKELFSRVDGMSNDSLKHTEQVQILQRKFDGHDEVQTELGHHLRRLQERVATAGDSPSHGMRAAAQLQALQATPSPESPGLVEIEDCLGRLAQAEDQIEALSGKVEVMRTNVELAPRIAGLVDTLKDVSPRVIGQEQTMRELQQRLSSFEEEMGGASASLKARVSRLEAEARRLVVEVEGIQECPEAEEEAAAEAAVVEAAALPLERDPRGVDHHVGDAAGLQRRATATE